MSAYAMSTFDPSTLEQRLKEREAAVAALDGPEKQAALMELSKLRNYAQAKRWLERN